MATTAVVESTPVPLMTESPYVHKAKSAAERALVLVVSSILDRTEAAEMGRAIAQLDKEVEEFFKPMKDSAFQTHRKICEREKEVRGPLERAKQYLSKQIGSFDQEQERQRRIEEHRIQQQERERAEIEGKRLADEQAIADAIALEAEGDKAGAEAVLNNPVPVEVVVPSVIIERQIPKVAGVSTQGCWKFRITDESLVPREYLMVNETAIRSVVRGLRGKTNIPGVEVYPESGARFRA